MKEERLRELLKIAVNHIENFEEDESKKVLMELGFTEDELTEINLKVELSEEDRKNIAMVQGKLVHNGDVIWELSEAGKNFIFSDQKADDITLNGWRTENIPFRSYSHYFYYDETRDLYTGFAWYSAGENYVRDFESLDECLDWLVPEREVVHGEGKESSRKDSKVIEQIRSLRSAVCENGDTEPLAAPVISAEQSHSICKDIKKDLNEKMAEAVKRASESLKNGKQNENDRDYR